MKGSPGQLLQSRPVIPWMPENQASIISFLQLKLLEIFGLIDKLKTGSLEDLCDLNQIHAACIGCCQVGYPGNTEINVSATSPPPEMMLTLRPTS